MKKLLKIGFIVMWVLLVAGAGTLVGFVEAEQYSRVCKGIDVTIDYGKADVLVGKPEIDSLVVKTAGNLKGKPLGYVNTGAIENAIRKQPYVAGVSVWENNEGILFVSVKQREPILRIINRSYESFYLDGSGALLPVNPNLSARVLVATGHIDDSFLKRPNYRVNIMVPADSIYLDSLLTNLYRLVLYINHDPFLKAQIEQIYVNEEKEFELVPRVGGHLILLGKAEDLEEKFNKLIAFYRNGLNRIGWNRYNTINIKYKNQVVCSKH